jgi:hypothetical protein
MFFDVTCDDDTAPRQNYVRPLESQQVITQLASNKIFGNLQQIFEFTKQQCAAIRDRVTKLVVWRVACGVSVSRAFFYV